MIVLIMFIYLAGKSEIVCHYEILYYAVYEVFLVLVSLNKINYTNNFSNAFTNMFANLFLSTVTQFYFTRWILYLTIKLPNRVKRGLAF